MRWNSAVGLGHLVGQVRDLRRGADARHDVLALRVDQVLAEEHLLTGVRVAGEGDPGAGVVAHVAEHHGHDVDGRAQVVGDLLVLAVVVGPLAEPAREDGLDGQVELRVRIGRELGARVLADDPLELAGHLGQGGRVEVGVGMGAAGVLGRVEGLVEALAVDTRARSARTSGRSGGRRPSRSGALPVSAMSPSRVCSLSPRLRTVSIMPGIENLAPERTDTSERVGGIAEALAGLPLDLVDRLQHVVPQPLGQALAGREVVVAGLGRDGEARRHRQPGVGHLGEPGALAAEQVAHRGVTFGASAAPGIDVALGGAMGALGGRGDGVGHLGLLRGERRGGRAGRPRSGRDGCVGDCTARTPLARPDEGHQFARRRVRARGPGGPPPGSG